MWLETWAMMEVYAKLAGLGVYVVLIFIYAVFIFWDWIIKKRKAK